MDTLQSHDARLLGLDDSWRVESVDLQIEDRRVEIRLSHVGSGVICPECGVACGFADHADERRWRHLDTMQFTTELVAGLPSSGCAEHGVETITPPWAGKPRLQQRHPGPEVRSARLPLLRQLPDSHPVLLREARSQAAATLPLKCRKNPFFAIRGRRGTGRWAGGYPSILIRRDPLKEI